jgi:hypothetical protein
MPLRGRGSGGLGNARLTPSMRVCHMQHIITPDASPAASTGTDSRPRDDTQEMTLHAQYGDSAWSLACVLDAACEIRDPDVDLKVRRGQATAPAAQLAEMHMRRQRLRPTIHEDDAISPRTPPCGRSPSPTSPPITPSLPRHANNQSGMMHRPTLQSIKVQHRLAKMRRSPLTLMHHAPLLELFERCC